MSRRLIWTGNLEFEAKNGGKLAFMFNLLLRTCLAVFAICEHMYTFFKNATKNCSDRRFYEYNLVYFMNNVSLVVFGTARFDNFR